MRRARARASPAPTHSSDPGGGEPRGGPDDRQLREPRLLQHGHRPVPYLHERGRLRHVRRSDPRRRRRAGRDRVPAASGGQTWTPAPTDAQVLRSVGAVPTWYTNPKARAFHNANHSVTDTVATILPFNSERFDTDAIHDTSTNNSRLTCKTAGTYLIGAQVEWGAGAGSSRRVSIRLNGTTEIANVFDSVNAVSQIKRQEVVTLYELAVNDFVEVEVLQISGGSLNIVAAGNYSPEFWTVRQS